MNNAIKEKAMKTSIKIFRIMTLGIVLLCACKEETYPVKLVYPDDPIIGTGTEEDPYDVASAIRKAKKETTSWIRGYIIGAVKEDITGIVSNDDIVYGAQGINGQTLLLASNNGENDYTKCILISLKDVNRSINANLNLISNPDNIGKEITIYGKLTQNMLGIKGVDKVTNATMGGVPIPIVDENNLLGLSTNTLSNVVSNNFSDIADGLIYASKGWTNIPIQGLSYWKGQIEGNEQFISLSTEHIAKDKKLETWLATPAFKVIKGKRFTFDCLLKNPSPSTCLTVYFWREENGVMVSKPIYANIISTTGEEWKRRINFGIDDEYTDVIGFIGFKFSTITDDNIQSCAIDNIQYGQEKVLFEETFGDTPIAIGTTIGVNAYKGYDNPNVFSAIGSIADLRCLPDCFNGTNVLSCIYGWGGMAFEDEVIMDVSSFIPNEGYGKMTLSFDVGAMDLSQPLSRMEIFCDDTPVAIKSSINVPLWQNIRVALELPLTSFKRIRFHFKGTGEGFGHCFDNITIVGE